MSSPTLTLNEERNLVLDYLLGVPVRALAVDFGIPRTSVYRVLARHDVTPDRKVP